MGGMRDVGFQSGLVLKGDEKAMGQALVLALDTLARAPFIIGDGVDLSGQLAERLFNGGDLRGRGAVLKLEHDDVAKFATGLGNGVGKHECDGDEEFQHARSLHKYFGAANHHFSESPQVPPIHGKDQA